MNIYIPNIDFKTENKRNIFILTRPFFTENGWSNHLKKDWNICEKINYVNQINKANIILLPLTINWYFITKNVNSLNFYNKFCQENNINAYGIVVGDLGVKYPDFSNIIFFRFGGFNNQLSFKNKGFPVSLSDHFERLFRQKNIIPKQKSQLPVIGFCGYASLSTVKKIKELSKCFLENCKRLLENPFRNDYEPFFASAYERYKLLEILKKSDKTETKFIYRKNYRGGSKNDQVREKTTLEYYKNLLESDYILCVRGKGNFSVRFYEALMMGKIPVFVDTNCLLPFEDIINWKNHVVWINWKDRNKIVEKIYLFHNNLNNYEYVNLQLLNRKIWKEKLSINAMLNYLN